MSERRLPAEIERGSMEIIRRELSAGEITLPETEAPVILRCIHASADFDYARNLRFTPKAVEQGVEALRRGAPIVTDTNMALAGLSRPGLDKLGSSACCFMADPQIAAQARKEGLTRAAASMDRAFERFPAPILAVGNAPTALLRIAEHMEKGWRPALVIGVPVGFVNVVESKERALELCGRYGVPGIMAMGRKGGSSIAAAVCNALIYLAADMLDPKQRRWS